MTPRPGHLATVESQGLTYAVDRSGTGEPVPYWWEHAAYEFTEDDVDHLADRTETLHGMAVEAARHLAATPRLLRTLRLPPAAERALRDSLDADADRSLYGRFDLAWDGAGDAKLLEYNADTPAALVEAAVTQWHWLEDVLPDRDQWNMLHEHLVKRWGEIAAPASRVHLAVGRNEPDEDWATVAYLADTVTEAGLVPQQIAMEDVGWDNRARRFVDLDVRHIETIFKMYPWEWMLREDFGRHVLDEARTTRWVEPLWKALLASKTLLVALWETFPDHPNLLPAWLGEPGDPRAGYVAKPVYGWEGAGIEIVTPDFTVRQGARHTAGQDVVYQAYTPLPRFDGPDVDRAYPVLGTWVVGRRAAGLGVRESSGPVTDTKARFVPSYMTTPRSTAEQVHQWLHAATDVG